MSELDSGRREPVKAAPAPWSRRRLGAMDGVALLRGVVGACLAQVRPNAEAIALGSDDPEHVHQLRIGLRRLRSAVHGLRSFAGGLPPGWDAAVRPVFEALGDARDRHVLATTILPKLDKAGVGVSDAGVSRGNDPAALRRLVAGTEFQQALRGLSLFASADGPQAGDEGEGLACLVSWVRKLARQVARGARRFDELPIDDRHDVRKRLKRLRYLAEFAEPAFDPARMRPWFERVAKAQDALGRYIDLSLAARRFAALAEADPEAGRAAAWLRTKARRRARSARKALERLSEARAFW